MDLTFCTDFVDFFDFTESADFFDLIDTCDDFFLTGFEISVTTGVSSFGDSSISSHRPVHELLGTVVGSEKVNIDVVR